MTKPYQFGWFSTGRDKAARDLLTTVNEAIKLGEIEAEIAFVFCNLERGEAKESDRFLKLVANYHLPLVVFSYQKFRIEKGSPSAKPGISLPQWRLDYDREVMSRLPGFTPDLCVFAGYMLIAGKEMCRKYNMINLHPAAPGGPSGAWQEVIWQLIDNEAEASGVMMHLVTPELDKGPPVAYSTFSIRGEPFAKYWREIERLSADSPKRQAAKDSLFKLIRKHGLAREFPLIVATLKAFSQGKIRITADKQVVDAEGKPLKGYNLTDEINGQLSFSGKIEGASLLQNIVSPSTGKRGDKGG